MKNMTRPLAATKYINHRLTLIFTDLKIIITCFIKISYEAIYKKTSRKNKELKDCSMKIIIYYISSSCPS
jgi:hypothetical protein